METTSIKKFGGVNTKYTKIGWRRESASRALGMDHRVWS